MTSSTSGVSTGKNRPTRYTPAATIVAECTSAETGVGPSMASGSQTKSGNWALLPTQPQKMPSPAMNNSQLPRPIARQPPTRAAISLAAAAGFCGWPAAIFATSSAAANFTMPSGTCRACPVAAGRTRLNKPGCTTSAPSGPVDRESANCSVPSAPHRAIRPMSMPKSPTRLTMNALLAAVEALFRS